MNKEKQIEEMACEKCLHHLACLTNSEYVPTPCPAYEDKAGYRKQSENTVELPCKVGDKVWCISNYTKPKEFQITILTMSENHYSFVIEADKGVYKHYCDKDSVGKYVFFTKAEAEKALAKMKGGAE